MKIKNPEHIVYVCLGSKCNKHGAKDLYKKMKSLIKKSGRQDVELIKTECTDRCKMAPVLSIQPQNQWLLNYETDEVIKKITSSVSK